MNKTDALESIREAWNDDSLSLAEKIGRIANDFYSVGLDVAGTAAYIHATEAELSAFLDLGVLDEETIEMISRVNPPKTTWSIFANASDEEIEYALEALAKAKDKGEKSSSLNDEYVYFTMMELSGPTVEQKVGNLSGDTLKHALKKAEDFNALNDWGRKFLRDIASKRKRGQVLTEKQASKLVEILNGIVDKKAIKRDSIDGDRAICNEIMDALGR